MRGFLVVAVIQRLRRVNGDVWYGGQPRCL